LRAEGLTYDEIAAKTGASKGSLSLWLRDQRGPNVVRPDPAEHIRWIQPRAVAAHRANAQARKSAAQQRGADAIGALDRSALFVAGVVLYWAEGSKDKPWRRSGRVVLINGDVDVIRLFLSWLDLVGVPEEDRLYRLNIHESADVALHERWWSDELGLPLVSFARATLKRHKPVTVRRNVGADYHGCLVVAVSRSSGLYDEIEGAWRRIVKDACSPFTVSDDSPP